MILNIFKRMSIQTKILVAPALLLLLILIKGGADYYSGQKSETHIKTISDDLVQDSIIVTELLVHIFQQRMAVKNYIQTSSKESVDTFQEYAKKYQLMRDKAGQAIVNQNRVKILGEIDIMYRQYNTTFDEVVVPNMEKRHRIVSEVMDVTGPKIEKLLNTMMEVAQNDNEVLYQASMAQQNLLSARLSAYKYLQSNEPVFFELTTLKLNELIKNTGEMSKFLKATDKLVLNDEVTKLTREYKEAFTEVVTAITTRNSGIMTMDKLGPQIVSKAKTLESSVLNSLKEKSKNVQDLIHSGNILSIFLTGIAILGGIFITKFVVRAIVKPLFEVNASLKEIAKGDGDLTSRLPEDAQDELGELATNFNNFTEKIQVLIISLQGSVNKLTLSAKELSSVTRDSHKRIEIQAIETDQVATAVEEMSATLKDVAQNVEQASGVTGQTRSEADKGRALEAEALASINALSQDIQKSVNVVEEVGRSSETVNNIVEEINGIAEQTNLLALNAAIEAARAGEQGRGFAVVADEVRILAMRTQDSTKEIRETVENLLTKIQHAITRIGYGRKQAENVVEQALQVDTVFSGISDSVNDIDGMATQISCATEEQTTVAEAISHSVLMLREQATETSSAINQVGCSAEELAKLADNIQSQIAQFKVA